ncbi:MATE family efflux transporter [Faecalibacterium sp. I4-3-84]|uniref:MATE family efflux transporter n=1 Tax=Faecalibacterium sp. I4-3-84 TaxID=2929495 RepID=UPI002014930D|nr:MATE family efflux transporter [Faecalibacterium sp. I4-3-84]UQK37494.1 MATE family efflux transporter [Faecalibacterium sp. I4-3-84]
MEKNLTSGSVLKSILFFSLPYLLSYFLQTLYGMADLFIIGQFEGVASTTAVSIGSQVMHMITVMIVGLAMGATVTIGRAVGAENKPRAARLIGNTVTLFMAGSVVLAAVLVGLVDPIVRIVSTPEQAVAGTRTYLIICFIGVPCITAYNIMASIFRGLGDSRSPMYFIAAGLCLASLAVVNEKEYILVTLGAPGNHATEQTNIMDAVQVYRRLEKKNDCFAPILPPVGCAGMSGPVQWSHKQNCWLTRRTKRCTN